MTDKKIAIIGLGYVGLPLAIEFGKVFKTVGFDTNKSRIKELLGGKDSTLEVSSKELQESPMLSYTTDITHLVVGWQKCVQSSPVTHSPTQCISVHLYALHY